MEEKELDLTQLLKGFEGANFYFVLADAELELKETFGTRCFFYLDKDDECTVECNENGCLEIGTLDDTGVFKTITYPNGRCVIYPSRALYEKYPLDPYSAWMKWAESRKPKRWRAKVGEYYYCFNHELMIEELIEQRDKYDDYRFGVGNYFRTEEEARQAVEVVKEALQKFHEKKSEK